jgi:hypothetical protein
MSGIGKSFIITLLLSICFSSLFLIKSGSAQTTSQFPYPTDAVLPTPNYTQPVDYAVAVYAGSGGNVNGIRGQDAYFDYPGSSFDFAITPDAGYQILDVTDNGVSLGAIKTYSLPNVQTSHTINATFAKIVTVSPSPSPTPSPTPSVPEFSWLILLPIVICTLSIAGSVRLGKTWK